MIMIAFSIKAEGYHVVVLFYVALVKDVTSFERILAGQCREITFPAQAQLSYPSGNTVLGGYRSKL